MRRRNRVAKPCNWCGPTQSVPAEYRVRFPAGTRWQDGLGGTVVWRNRRTVLMCGWHSAYVLRHGWGARRYRFRRTR